MARGAAEEGRPRRGSLPFPVPSRLSRTKSTTRVEWQRASPFPFLSLPTAGPSRARRPTPDASPCRSPARRSSAPRSRWPCRARAAPGRWRARAHVPAPASQSSGWGGRAAAFQNPGEPRAAAVSPPYTAPYGITVCARHCPLCMTASYSAKFLPN